jgi:hypothetical protein
VRGSRLPVLRDAVHYSSGKKSKKTGIKSISPCFDYPLREGVSYDLQAILRKKVGWESFTHISLLFRRRLLFKLGRKQIRVRRERHSWLECYPFLRCENGVLLFE